MVETSNGDSENPARVVMDPGRADNSARAERASENSEIAADEEPTLGGGASWQWIDGKLTQVRDADGQQEGAHDDVDDQQNEEEEVDPNLATTIALLQKSSEEL